MHCDAGGALRIAEIFSDQALRNLILTIGNALGLNKILSWPVKKQKFLFYGLAVTLLLTLTYGILFDQR